MKTIKIGVVLGLTIALAACGLYVKGMLSVQKELTFTQKTLFGTKKLVIPPGTYSSAVEFNGNRDQVILDIDNVNGKNLTAKFNAPIESMPIDGTWVEIGAAQTGQEYDARVSALRQIEKEDELRHEWEHCTYQRCYQVCTGQGQNHECHQECDTYQGDRYTEYYLVHTYWDVAFKLGKSGSFNHASFKGKRHDITRDHTYVGPCR